MANMGILEFMIRSRDARIAATSVSAFGRIVLVSSGVVGAVDNKPIEELPMELALSFTFLSTGLEAVDCISSMNLVMLSKEAICFAAECLGSLNHVPLTPFFISVNVGVMCVFPLGSGMILWF